MKVTPIETDLDKLSNSVLDQIAARNYEEAEKLCRKLLLEYPEVIDGHERLAAVRQAQGRFQEAATEFSMTLEMISRKPGDFGQELVTLLTEQRDEALAKAKR